ncbi:hypothetical protein XENTR_v10013925 [Xenopus tropicalis]|nr:hypothetical protein XENTR_v10013925 [Xenopus tropicalis]
MMGITSHPTVTLSLLTSGHFSAGLQLTFCIEQPLANWFVCPSTKDLSFPHNSQNRGKSVPRIISTSMSSTTTSEWSTVPLVVSKVIETVGLLGSSCISGISCGDKTNIRVSCKTLDMGNLASSVTHNWIPSTFTSIDFSTFPLRDPVHSDQALNSLLSSFTSAPRTLPLSTQSQSFTPPAYCSLSTTPLRTVLPFL